MTEIPASFLDLIQGPRVAAFTTLMPDGSPQTTVVWCDFDGDYVCVNTSRERQKGKNMKANSRVSLLIVDPENTGRFLQIRGEVELVEDGALEHLDAITRKYTSHPQYYGYVFPLEKKARETRIMCRIHAKKITLDAIHG